ncbi:MAG: FtsX-like permease family protein [Firmicutes bacterium]|nr:FtsX-like permease family protein [Candidatus Colivicinus equi]
MFEKDTLRLIKKSFNRFLSLLMIVFISSAFMMGLMSNPTLMRKSVDKYNDDYNLQDIQLYSTYGFCDDDVEALKKAEGIALVEPSKQVDVYCESQDGKVYVARVLEADPVINQFELTDGRLPSNNLECLVIGDIFTDLNIGKKLHLFLNDSDSDVKDYLKNVDFKIVGNVKTPAYLCKSFSSSNLDNKDLDIVIYVPRNNFVFDYYTTILLTLDGSKELISYTNNYKDFIDDNVLCVDNVASKQQDFLKDKILKEYEEELDKGRQELIEAQNEGLAKLEDAKRQIDDANIKIVAGEMEIENYKGIINSVKSEAEDTQDSLEKRKKTNDILIDNIETEFGDNFESISTKLAKDYSSYVTNKATIELAKTNLENLKKERNSKREELKELTPGSKEYYELQKQILVLDGQIVSAELLFDSGYYKNIEDENVEIDNYYKSFGYDDVEDAFASINSISAENLAVDAAIKALEKSYDYIEDIQKQIDDKASELEDGKREYQKGLEEYNLAVKEFNTKIEKANAEIKKSEQKLADLPEASWIVTDRDSHFSSYMYDASCSQMQAIGYALPTLFYLVAALVCMTTMTRLIDEQRGQIGIFRALGFSKRQIIGKYVTYVILATFIGCSIGVIVGQFLFPTVIYNTWRLLYDLPQLLILFPIKDIAICFIAFMVLMVLVTALVTYNNILESPSQLLRPKAPKNGKEVFLEKFHFLWNRLTFTSKITARNLLRYKSRFLMTVIGVAGCTGLLIIGWGVKDSIAGVLEVQFGQIFNYNYTINLKNDYHIDDDVKILENNYDNEAISPFMSYMTKVYLEDDDKTASVQVYNCRDYMDVIGTRKTDKKTDLNLTNNGVIVSEKFASNNDLKPGDFVTIESINGVKADAKIYDICEMYFSHYIFISDNYYEEIFDEPMHANAIAVRNINEDSLMKDVEKIEDFESCTDFSGVMNIFEKMISALDMIIAVIIIAAGSLALVVLINLTQVNISERIREIATLKVLGFRRNEVNAYIFKEIILLTFIGAIIGLPLGVIEHHFIMNVIDMEMVKFGMNIKPLSFVYAFLITIVFAIAVLFCMRKPLKEVDMIESLKSVE